MSSSVRMFDADRTVDLVAGVDRARLVHPNACPLTGCESGMHHGTERLNSPIFHDVFRCSLRMPWNEGAFPRRVGPTGRRRPVLRAAFDQAGSAEPLPAACTHASRHPSNIVIAYGPTPITRDPR